MIKITEYFKSIQGEGKRTGRLSLFLRFYGCNLNCSFCDETTSYNENKLYAEYDEKLLAQKIRKEHPNVPVIITGGEPFVQKESLKILLDELYSKVPLICIETNATIDPYFLGEAVFVSASPKLVGEKYFYNENAIKRADEIKLVIDKTMCEKEEINQYYSEQISEISSLRKNESIPIFLQPEYSDKENMSKVIYNTVINCKNTETLIAGSQVHKFWGWR